MPVITRYWFSLSAFIPLLGRFGLINPQWMYLDWELFAYRFQVSFLCFIISDGVVLVYLRKIYSSHFGLYYSYSLVQFYFSFLIQ